MPDVGDDVMAIMNLHTRCRTNRSLPYSGGIQDQPAYIMGLFDVIDGVRADFHKTESERQRDEAIRAKLSEGLTRAR